MSSCRHTFLTAVASLALLPGSASARESAAVLREPSLEDIVNVRSIDGLMISPDGKKVAYRVTSPNFRSNKTEVQWFSVPVDGSGPPLPLGVRHVPIWLPLYDAVDLPQAHWLSNSSIAALALVDDIAQVRELGPNGADRPLTNDPADVVSFKVEGRTLSYETRADRSVIAAAQASESERGIRLNRSLDTDGLRLTDNFRVGNRLVTIRRKDEAFGIEAHAGELISKEVALADTAPAGRPPQFLSSGTLKVGTNSLKGPNGELTVTVMPPGDNEERFRKYTISFTATYGRSQTCEAAFCKGITSALKGVTFSRQTGEVIAFSERDFADRTAILAWNPWTGKSRTLRPANGSLGGGATYGESPCAFGSDFAICVSARPTEPASLVRIELATGVASRLAAPNADLAERQWGEQRLLEWKDDQGRTNHGVLLLPKKRDGPLPLVMTTYRCRGFLRGGTAWHVAEHMLIQRGIAALCVSTNVNVLTERGADGKRIPLGPHLAQIAGYKAIIDRLANEGVIDPKRVGISGHSFTSMVVTYAISHTDLFAAAESVGNTIDPGPYIISSPMPDSYRSYLYPAMGLPLPSNDPDGEIAKASPALNARNIKAPLLMQPPESEYICALQLYSAIAENKGAVDLYVYPFEDHLGSREPAHIYWRNRRALDWFAFWLTGKEYPDPAYPEQYQHWRAMRAARTTVSATSKSPAG